MELDLMTISSDPLLPLTLARVRLVWGCTLRAPTRRGPRTGCSARSSRILTEERERHRRCRQEVKARIEDFFKKYKTDEGEEVRFAGWFDRVTAVDKVEQALKVAKKHRK